MLPREPPPSPRTSERARGIGGFVLRLAAPHTQRHTQTFPPPHTHTHTKTHKNRGVKAKYSILTRMAGILMRDLASCSTHDGLMPPHKLQFILSRRNASVCGRGEPSVAFVGVGKAGSLFMQTVLELYAHEQLLPTVECGKSASAHAVGARMGWHHASALLWSRAYGNAWDTSFTFGIVRNPWSRLVSHWAFHIGKGSNPLDGGHLTPTQRAQAQANETLSIQHFRSWVRHARRSHPPGHNDSWRFTTADAHGNEQSPASMLHSCRGLSRERRIA